MVSKDDKPGLLSKVAMFVRNPTRDWSELEQPVDTDAGGYDKQALKAMIERKRQNDFVRKREFDQLRKLRNRDPGALASMARPSFFQTSLPTDLDGRAVTLKKIDEIEAQMSRQWWKGKGENPNQPASSVTPRAAGIAQAPVVNSGLLPQPDPGLTVSFAATVPYDVRNPGGAGHGDEFESTQMADELTSVPAMDMLEESDARAGRTAGFSTTRLFAIEVDEMATDPELEEAAIRFANSDDAGAESGLLAALRGNDLAPHAAQSWAAALLDFYRATNQQTAFESSCAEFALHLDGARPVWLALGGSAPVAPAVPAQRQSGAIWDSPAHLTAHDMERLRSVMMSKPMPWHLGWGALERIERDAVPLLEGLFGGLCDEAAVLRFDGEASLPLALRALTPSGGRGADAMSWQLRLNALRAMGLQDDFELAALEYCFAFGSAPTPWVDAQCQIQMSGAGHDALQPAPDTAYQMVAPEAGEGVSQLVLQGEVLGDATQALAMLDSTPAAGKYVLIACRDLVRVDFAAAGSILNWVAMRQAEGKQVQFQNVHRLVAAFFNVIGINEHAKILPRPI